MTTRLHQLIQNPHFLFPLILLWAIILRTILYTAYPFGFDQIQIAENASQIAQGDFKLIGPRTGPAEMFTGPLIYYLTAPITYFVTPALATIIVAIIISLITGLAIHWLSHRYSDRQTSLIMLTLWAFSPLLIHFDRIPWNPNLTLLAASCVFFPLLKTKSLNVSDGLIIATGTFLGYQAHFAGLLLLPLSLLSLFVRKQPKLSLLPIGGFIISLLPTLLFDYRHEWLNLRGFTQLISNKDAVSLYELSTRLFQKTYIVFETIGKFIFETNQPVFILSVGILLTLIYFHFYPPLKHHQIINLSATLSALWITSIIAIFALYRASTPEYYFFPLLPVIIYLLSSIISKTSISPVMLVLALGLYASAYTVDRYHQNPGLTYGNLLATANQIQQHTNQQPIKSIILDMQPVDILGLKYFLSQKSFPLSPTGTNIHVSYPTTPSLFTTSRIGDIAIWLDSRNTPDYHYTNSQSEIIGVPENWQIMETKLPTHPDSSVKQYQLLIPDTGPFMLLHLPVKHVAKLPQPMPPQPNLPTIPLKNNPELVWQPSQFNQITGYYIVSHPHSYFIATQSPEIITQIEINTTTQSD